MLIFGINFSKILMEGRRLLMFGFDIKNCKINIYHYTTIRINIYFEKMLKIQTGESNEILRTVSKDVKKEEFGEFIKLGKQMIKFIKDPKNGGVGLAAPQIGINKNLIVVSLLRDRDDEGYKTILMINPKILEYSSETNFEKEGCLSVPGAKGLVERANEIKLSFVDESKKEQIFYFKGLSARIIQHEVDHLNGILFVDRIVEKGKILNF